MPAAIAFFSYFSAAIAFLLLSTLLLFKWRSRRSGVLLVVACLTTAAWAGTTAYSVGLGITLNWPIGVLEIARNGIWSAFLIALLHPVLPKRLLFGHQVSQYAIGVGAYHLALLGVISVAGTTISSISTVVAFINGGIGMAGSTVIGMLLIEHLLRCTTVRERWAIKFACLGIGSIFAFDFYFYIDAILFNWPDAQIWACRGIAAAFSVPLIAVSAARNPSWSTSIAVSRRVVFHSVTLIGAALYLLAVAGAGYYLQFFGGEWGTMLQMTFLFGAALLLLVTLFSGSFRSWLKVSISKHFYSYGYDYREEWLRFTRSLSAPGPQLAERAIEAIGSLVESSKGILFVRDASGRYCLHGEWNIDFARKTPNLEVDVGNDQLYAFLNRKHWVIDVPECRSDPTKYEGLVMPDWLFQMTDAWLIIPLLQDAGLFGFVVLSKSKTRLEVDWEVRDLLKIVGMQTASYLAKQQTANDLAVARQFETFNRMSTFVVHDLKNLVSQLALLTANAEKYKDSPEFQKDMLETIDHSVQKMRLLLQKFQRESSIEQSSPVRLEAVLDRVVAEKKHAVPRPALKIIAPELVILGDAARLHRVIGHLVQNAIEATPRDGNVTVVLDAKGGNAVIEVKDDGRGMTPEFIRTRLFKPFESTKAAGMGIGVFESREYLQQLGGQLEVSSREANGTTFRIILPIHNAGKQRVLNVA